MADLRGECWVASDPWGAQAVVETNNIHLNYATECGGIEAVREENAWLWDQALKAAHEIDQLGPNW